MQHPRAAESPLLDVLMCLRRRLGQVERPWAVTGSMGFSLQGLPVEVHDIDLQTDREGAYAIEEIFTEAVVQPVALSGTERVRSYFGTLELQGARIEIMGDLQKRLPDGSWEPPVTVAEHLRYIEVRGLSIPVLDLRYEAEAYRTLGRHDRADMLARWLDANNTR